MDFGVGLDGTLGLSIQEEMEVSREAARLGYTSIWTPEGTGQDSFQVCNYRWAASRDVVPEGLHTGISVSPVMWRSPMAFAMSGGTMSQVTGGRFYMGIGAGGVYQPRARQQTGMARVSALAMMRDYLTVIRGLVAGERVTYEGETVTLRGGRLGIRPAPNTPVYLGALGPRMLELAGEAADGASLNWCDSERVAWSRERVDDGAKKAGRDPSEVKLAEYIRVCVDDDEDAARRAFALSTMNYALGPRVPTERQRRLGYRAHFERMGFTDALRELDEMRSNGASREEVADAFPAELLLKVGYFGKSHGAAAHFRALAEGLDIAMVRVVAARPGNIDSTLGAIRACRPELLS